MKFYLLALAREGLPGSCMAVIVAGASSDTVGYHDGPRESKTQSSQYAAIGRTNRSPCTERQPFRLNVELFI